MTLTEFLLARYDEDEADAEQMLLDLGRWDRERELSGADGTQGSIIAATLRGGAFDPARVLAECEAKRRIVGLADEVTELEDDKWHRVGIADVSAEAGYSRPPFLTRTLLEALALPYADHPDFQPDWK